MQGYALTETCSIATVMNVKDRTIGTRLSCNTERNWYSTTLKYVSTGTTGDPMSCCEIKLVNWEEGNYRVKDVPNPRGEIHIGGPNVAVGYYKEPEKTREEFYQENGKWWFRTGDIGEFTTEGRLQVYLYMIFKIFHLLLLELEVMLIYCRF